MRQILVVPEGSRFFAYLLGSSEINGVGDTVDEAIIDLLKQSPDFAITVVETPETLERKADQPDLFEDTRYIVFEGFDGTVRYA